MDDINSVLKTIKEDGAEKIILFGSQVNGDPGEDSDYDIAVIKDTDLPFHTRLSNLRMKIKTNIPIDLFVFTPKEFKAAQQVNPFITEIAENGKVIYG